MFAPLDDLETAVDKAALEHDLDLEQMHRIAQKVESLHIQVMHEYARSEQWKPEGFLTAAAAVREKTRMTHGIASAALTLGEKLEQLPEVAAAFTAGAISRHHVQAITDACTPERVDAIRDVERELVDVARLTNASSIRAVARRLADALDGDGGATNDWAEYERRSVYLSKTLKGRYRFDGDVDGPSGEIVATAFNAVMDADHPAGDTRTRAQRRADALVEICQRFLDNGVDYDERGARPHLSVVADLEEINGTSPELVAQARADAANLGHLSKATLEWIACDCNVSRVIMAGRSQVLDVGRATRKWPKPIWRAIVARDRHCTAPGCNLGPAWCDVHHVRWWENGRRTSVENGTLKCRRHHREEHMKPRRE